MSISYDNAKAIHRVFKKETRTDKRKHRRRVTKPRNDKHIKKEL
jgi:hypothetical protein